MAGVKKDKIRDALFGSGIRIESPSSLIEKVRSYARELVSLYEGN